MMKKGKLNDEILVIRHSDYFNLLYNAQSINVNGTDEGINSIIKLHSNGEYCENPLVINWVTDLIIRGQHQHYNDFYLEIPEINKYHFFEIIPSVEGNVFVIALSNDWMWRPPHKFILLNENNANTSELYSAITFKEFGMTCNNIDLGNRRISYVPDQSMVSVKMTNSDFVNPKYSLVINNSIGTLMESIPLSRIRSMVVSNQDENRNFFVTLTSDDQIICCHYLAATNKIRISKIAEGERGLMIMATCFYNGRLLIAAQSYRHVEIMSLNEDNNFISYYRNLYPSEAQSIKFYGDSKDQIRIAVLTALNCYYLEFPRKGGGSGWSHYMWI